MPVYNLPSLTYQINITVFYHLQYNSSVKVNYNNTLVSGLRSCRIYPG